MQKKISHPYQLKKVTNEKQKQHVKKKITQVKVLKKQYITSYPYYPVAHSLSKNEISYLFTLGFNKDYYLVVSPFKQNQSNQQYQIFHESTINVNCLPAKIANFLYILSYDDIISNKNSQSVIIKSIDFMVGFQVGFLIRCKYTDDGKYKKVSIIGKFNKSTDYSQGVSQKLGKYLFDNDQSYKISVQKPIKQFKTHNESKIQKYKYSYLIGKRLYLCEQLTQQLQNKTISQFQKYSWEKLKENYKEKLPSGIKTIKKKKQKILILPKSMIIECMSQISCYIYTSNNELIIPDNQENQITIYDAALQIQKQFYFDLDVKKMTYFINNNLGGLQKILLIMPYDNKLYIVNLTNNTIVAINKHRSYISNAVLTKSGFVITGGTDSMIWLINLKEFKNWSKISSKKSPSGEQNSRLFQIITSQVSKSQTQCFGNFNNTNEIKNINSVAGFGNFLSMGNTSMLYAFLTFDYFVKIYRILI